MNNLIKKQDKELTAGDKISILMVLFLLFVRLADQDLFKLIFGSNIPVEFGDWYATIVFVLCLIYIWIKRNNLLSINIDKPFLRIVILAGGMLAIFYLSGLMSLIVGVIDVFMCVAFYYGEFDFGHPTQHDPHTWLWILLALVPILPMYISKINLPIKSQVDASFVFGSILDAQLPLIVFEELLFRGMLWSLLRSFGLNDRIIFYVQALLFWIAHRRFILVQANYSFWVATPFFALLLGIMVWRYKSLEPSTTAHFLINLVIAFINNAY